MTPLFLYYFKYQLLIYHALLVPALTLLFFTDRSFFRWHILGEPGGERLRGVLKEYFISITSLAIFATILAVLDLPIFSPWVKIYINKSDYSLLWYYLSLPILLLYHDFFLYWAHRALHSRFLYRPVHSVHHTQKYPGPVSTFLLSPIEAAINMLWLIPIYFVVPVHQGVMKTAGIFSMFLPIFVHLGSQFWSLAIKKTPSLWWTVTPEFHTRHHQNESVNFGIFFSIWDRMMNTSEGQHREHDRPSADSSAIATVELSELKSRILKQDFDVLKVSKKKFDVGKYKKIAIKALNDHPPVAKDGYEKYTGLGLQYSDEANPFYDAMEQLFFITPRGEASMKRKPAEFLKRNSVGDLFKELYDFVEPECYLTRGRILVAESGFRMAEHIDGPFSVTLHFPVLTDSRSLLFVDGKPYHLPADGSLYVVNVAKSHFIVNESPSRRIHITFPLCPLNFHRWKRSQLNKMSAFFEKFANADLAELNRIQIESENET